MHTLAQNVHVLTVRILTDKVLHSSRCAAFEVSRAFPRRRGILDPEICMDWPNCLKHLTLYLTVHSCNGYKYTL